MKELGSAPCSRSQCTPSSSCQLNLLESFAGLENDSTYGLHHFFRLGLGALTLNLVNHFLVNHFLGYRFRPGLGAPGRPCASHESRFGPCFRISSWRWLLDWLSFPLGWRCSRSAKDGSPKHVLGLSPCSFTPQSMDRRHTTPQGDSRLVCGHPVPRLQRR